MTRNHFDNPLPGVPSIESPFFSEIFAQLDLPAETRRMADELHTHGFTIFKFPDPDFDRLAELIKQALHGQYDWAFYDRIGFEKGLGLRIQDAWTSNPDVGRIAANQTILDLLSTLYGRRAFPFQTLNFPVGTQQHFHTDTVHFSSVPERFMCGVWVALEDVTEDSGPLFYYPGSHRWPIYANDQIGRMVAGSGGTPTQSSFEPLWEALVKTHGVEPVTFLPKKGEALIWTANLLHGGSRQLDKSRTRWSQVTHYYFEDCAYYTPMNSDPFYGLIDFRRIHDIRDGSIVENSYLGEEIDKQFIASVRGVSKLPADFNPADYLAANPDVAAAGEDPVEHYLRHGFREKRRLRP